MRPLARVIAVPGLPRGYAVHAVHAALRVQFGTMSYIITSNLMYYHDGDKWITRDWATIMGRWDKKRPAAPAPLASNSLAVAGALSQ